MGRDPTMAGSGDNELRETLRLALVSGIGPATMRALLEE